MDGVFAFFPVAGAQLIRLQGIQNPQNFIRVTTYAQIRHHHKTNDAFGVNDEGGPLGNTGFFIQNAQIGAQPTKDRANRLDRRCVDAMPSAQTRCPHWRPELGCRDR